MLGIIPPARTRLEKTKYADGIRNIRRRFRLANHRSYALGIFIAKSLF